MLQQVSTRWPPPGSHLPHSSRLQQGPQEQHPLEAKQGQHQGVKAVPGLLQQLGLKLEGSWRLEPRAPGVSPRQLSINPLTVALLT